MVFTRDEKQYRPQPLLDLGGNINIDFSFIPNNPPDASSKPNHLLKRCVVRPDQVLLEKEVTRNGGKANKQLCPPVETHDYGAIFDFHRLGKPFVLL